MDLWNLLNLLMPTVVSVASVFVVRAIKKPSDAERAALLGRIAADATALVTSKNPNAPWAVLTTEVIRQIRNATGVPTTNAAAIERAAASALTAAGAAK